MQDCTLDQLRIATCFDARSADRPGEATALFYQERIGNALEQILPTCFTEDDQETLQQLEKAFHALPFASAVLVEGAPDNMTFYTLNRSHPDAFKCFYNWINSRLIPDKQPQIVHMESMNFQLPDMGPESYTLCEITVQVDSRKELEIMRRRFPLIKSEQEELGLVSLGHAERMADTQSLTIDHVMYPVFMPSNEEEIIRNILSLSNQLKYVRDIPQMMITFDRQTRNSLLFTVVIVRVLHSDSKKIQELFKGADTILEFIPDRAKNLGLLRKRHAKEATVFHVKVPKNAFLRADHSLDLFKARQVVVKELEQVIGEVRDFNGGMIAQQAEMLSGLIGLLKDSGDYPEFLIENFFYSLAPNIMRYVIEPEALKTLFLMLLQVEENELIGVAACSIHTQRETNYTFAAVLIRDFDVKACIDEEIAALALPSNALVSATMYLDHHPCLGFIYQCDDPVKQRKFCQAIQQGCR
jgi:hypothetical protein